MRKILESRKLLGATAGMSLQELSGLYKSLMKAHHPDKFIDAAEKTAAEAYSKELIDAYHFLVSIAPETHAQQAEEYTATTNSGVILDWQYKAQTLQLNYSDGSTYEYFNVPANVYNKFVNNQGNLRFARRHICTSFTRRRVKKADPVAV
ncbi:MAG: KTSC domain-containing protein [Flavobacteriales bacterium]|nr:KTSC domain-containing protein [Flavobacteriales bacterium]